jgi:hypothetical protein
MMEKKHMLNIRLLTLTHVKMMLTALRMKSTPTVQLKLASQSTKISSTTNQVSTSTLLVTSLVDMLLRLSVGVLRMALTTGSVLTHGVHHGENKASSELLKEIVVLMLLSGSVTTLVKHTSDSYQFLRIYDF